MKLTVFVALMALFSLGSVRVATAQPLLERLERSIRGRIDDALTPAPVPDTGAPTPAAGPGYLGVIGDDRAERGRGVRVLSVRERSPAHKAGLAPGDLIVLINGQAVPNLTAMGQIVGGARAGEKLDLSVERSGRRVMLSAVLSARPDAPVDPFADTGRLAEHSLLKAPERASLGIRVVPLTEQLRGDRGLAVRQGAVIQSVTPGAAADRAGLPSGAVIVAYNGRRIDTTTDLIENVARSRPGEQVEITFYQDFRIHRKKVVLGSTATVLPPEPPPADTADDEDLILPKDPRPDGPATEPVVPAEPAAETGPKALREVERILDHVLPGGTTPAPTEPAPNVKDLTDEIRTLRSQVDALQRRVEQLEQLLKKRD